MEVARGRYVAVRLMDESDSPHVVEWRNREDAARWFYNFEPLQLEASLAWFRKARDHDLLFVFETPEGERVGMGSIYGFDRRRGRSADWGRFLAARVPARPLPLFEAAYLAHRVAFDALGMRRMTAEVAAANERSARMLFSLGYQREGLRRKHYRHANGELDDAVMLGMFPEDFARERPTQERLLYRGKSVPEIPIEPLEPLRRMVDAVVPEEDEAK